MVLDEIQREAQFFQTGVPQKEVGIRGKLPFSTAKTVISIFQPIRALLPSQKRIYRHNSLPKSLLGPIGHFLKCQFDQ
jgi:hypothetical protein